MAHYTVLVVDYEPRSIAHTTKPLEEAGYHVEVAQDGLTALRRFTELKPDLVLIEAMIPKKHGFEVCQEIKRSPEGRHVPVVITTGVYRGRKYRSQAFHVYGADEYLEKPFSAEALLQVCRRFLRNGDEPGHPEAPAASASAGGTASATAAPGRPSTVPEFDLSEDEIMARLEAILPGHAATQSDRPAAQPFETRGGAAVGGESSGLHAEENRAPLLHVAGAPSPPWSGMPHDEPAVMAVATDPVPPPEQPLIELLDSEELQPDQALAEREAEILELPQDALERAGPGSASHTEEPTRSELGPATTWGPTGEGFQPLAEPSGPAAEPLGVLSTEEHLESVTAEAASQDFRTTQGEEVSPPGPPGGPIPAARSPREVGLPDPEDSVFASAVRPSGGPGAEPEAVEAWVPDSVVAVDSLKTRSGRSAPFWVGVAAIVLGGLAFAAWMFLGAERGRTQPRATAAPRTLAEHPSSPESGASVIVQSPKAEFRQQETTDTRSEPRGAQPRADPSQPQRSLRPGAPADSAALDSSRALPASNRRAEEQGSGPRDEPRVGTGVRGLASSAEPVAPFAERELEVAPAGHSRLEAEAIGQVGRLAAAEGPPAPPPVPQAAAVAFGAGPEPVIGPAPQETDPAGPRVPSTTAVTPHAESSAGAGEALSESPPEATPASPELPAAAEPSAFAKEPSARGAAPLRTAGANIPARQTRPGDLVPLEKVDVPPEPLSRALPQYPPAAMRAHHEGTVRMRLLIDEHGEVERVEITEPSHYPELNEAAVRAAQAWRFTPARKDRVPVKVWKPEKIVFKL